MTTDENEEKLLLSVTLQNAQSILAARQRAEQELVQSKEALELKTKELAQSVTMMRATLESATDGILVTDESGKVTDYNGNFVEIWRVPREAMDSREHRQLLEVAGRQFKDSEGFRKRVNDIYASAPPGSYDLLELLDGRVIERYSRIQRISERNVGRVWSFRDITDRRRAEQALQKESEWLRVTLASIGDAVITTDAEGRVTSLNPMAQSLTGWTLQQVNGRTLNTIFCIINEQSREPAEDPATRALREGRIVGLANHTILIAKDGTERAIDDCAAPIRDDRENIIGVVLIFRDITEQRQDQERLRESEAELADFFENATIGLHWVGPEGTILRANRAELDLLGFSREEYIGHHIADFHVDQDVICDILKRLRAGERLVEFPAQLKCRNGSVKDVLIDSSSLWKNGKFVHTRCFTRDVTDRKKAEQERRQAEQTTRFLADASAALAQLTDYESTLQKVASLAVPVFADWCAVDILEADGSLQRLALAHIEPAKVELAQELQRLYPPLPSDSHGVMEVLRAGQPDWMAEISDSLLIESARDAEHLKLLRELGLKSYVCVPLRSRTKTFGALTFVTAESRRCYDVIDLKAAEDLADRAVIAIENASLLTTLKEADRRKDEFLAMLAHELRNPLAPIRNAVQILNLKGPAVRELQWAREVIDRQVQQMTRLVDDLLDVSRITRGRIELREERVDLATVVNSAVETSSPLIHRQGHELTVTIPPEPIYLEADLTRLSQVLMNLLTNAAKYTNPGGHIWLTGDRQGDHLLIRVTDTGIGIAADMLPHVFEMFKQVDRSLARSEGGLGIGLTLVRQLVEMHGGTVEAHSPGLGKGSEFVLRLPVVSEVEEKPQTAAKRKEATTAARCRILVVDDNQDSADSISILLRTMGHEVHTAYDGLEAVGAAAEFQPDVVLLDIGLPNLNGYDAARRIREQQGGPERMLIALTGWGQEQDRNQSKEAGFDHHLTKPIDFDDLRALLAASKIGHTEGRSAKR